MVPNSKEHHIPVVYLITCLVNGKIYVGSAKDFYKRYVAYGGELRQGQKRAIIFAMRKHGFDAFEFTILERLNYASQCIVREQYWIDTLKPFGQDGYNECRVAGSCLGMKLSAEAVAKMTVNARLRVPEQIIRQSRPVLQIDKKTLEVIKEWESLRVAAIAYNINPSCISQACNRICHSAAGYYWAHKDTYDKQSFKPLRRTGHGLGWIYMARPVRQLALDGSLIRVWDHSSDAASSLGVNKTNINKCCRGKRPKSHGYKWEYETDSNLIDSIRDRLVIEWRTKNA